MADKPFALSSIDNTRTFLITREHNPAKQPAMEYEQAYVSTAIRGGGGIGVTVSTSPMAIREP
ncbi:hypothetical protein T06_1208 [Trichinella sp. T6]|nr:hypothetical protein T06_1208 [Trichinella sp. T6]